MIYVCAMFANIGSCPIKTKINSELALVIVSVKETLCLRLAYHKMEIIIPKINDTSKPR